MTDAFSIPDRIISSNCYRRANRVRAAPNMQADASDPCLQAGGRAGRRVPTHLDRVAGHMEKRRCPSSFRGRREEAWLERGGELPVASSSTTCFSKRVH
ncbi:hypothetical protein NL676_004306 [Syzygium grande]|nr:hypothetical protein NL676_004306 [Syzygium grande]